MHDTVYKFEHMNYMYFLELHTVKILFCTKIFSMNISNLKISHMKFFLSNYGIACMCNSNSPLIYLFLDFVAALMLEGHAVQDGPFFDTIEVSCSSPAREAVLQRAKEKCVNLRHFEDGSVSACL